MYVNEIFYSIQGEGAYTGTPAVFVRLQGCLCHCAFCDTKQTWKVPKSDDHRSFNIVEKVEGASWSEMTEEEILDIILKNYPQARLVVLTGGEPLMQNCRKLCDLLIANGLKVAVETSGTEYQELSKDVFVTVSPKFGNEGERPVLMKALKQADEIKMVIGSMKDMAELEKWLPHISGRISLQPLSAGRESTELCIRLCKERGFNLSVQMHKLIGIR